MKILYFDCSAGITGNMILGALTEILGDEFWLINELRKLNTEGYEIKIKRRIENDLRVAYIEIALNQSLVSETIKEAADVIDESSLSEYVKDLSRRIFSRLTEAESKVQGTPLLKNRYPEKSVIESMICIVGTAILLERIRPDRILSSAVYDGYGIIQSEQGLVGLPQPLVMEIFAQSHAVFGQLDVNRSLVDPVGAAIIAELAEQFVPMPAMKLHKVGWGAEKECISSPHVLKVCLGETVNQEKADDLQEEDFYIMETNLDDCSGEILGYTMELLFEAGALDAFYTPVFMKKNRPAWLLTVACHKKDMEKLQEIIFRETTTIGIRYRKENRTRLEREMIMEDTPYGPVKAKKVVNGKETYVYPEYENLKEIARKENIPLKDLYRIGGYKFHEEQD